MDLQTSEHAIEFEDVELQELIDSLEKWGEQYGIRLKLLGAVGLDRKCTGFVDKAGNYVYYNPMNLETFEYYELFYDERLRPPDGVGDAYQEWDTMCILRPDTDDGEGEIAGIKEALRQLKIWTDHLDALGELEVKPYDTGLRGMKALFMGETGYAIKLV